MQAPFLERAPLEHAPTTRSTAQAMLLVDAMLLCNAGMRALRVWKPQSGMRSWERRWWICLDP